MDEGIQESPCTYESIQKHMGSALTAMTNTLEMDSLKCHTHAECDIMEADDFDFH